ncbi:tRNA:m4X modification enzyme [Entomortierella parvispora]|uniref:tRNA:m(4)X modification enzyme TRM13 n=1 Tax=Entomortierella parvispora TaxID=205924 RepID=A0A9P3H750_9FUNG|nr:tRNA:m4X modification enzyme [Entomortierella parvispora]
MENHPVICQHSIWGSKQQRFRHCKLPAKLEPALVNQIKQLEQSAFTLAPSDLTEDERKSRVDLVLEQRAEILKPLLDLGKVLCGHHQKEAQAKQSKEDQIEKEKAAGTYVDPEELKRLAKDPPVDPNDIPKDFLEAVNRIYTQEPSLLLKSVLDQFDGPEDWKRGNAGPKSSHEEVNGKEGEPEFPCHRSYDKLFSDAGAKKKRHLAQESQLIELMEARGVFDPVLGTKGNLTDGSKSKRPVFVEFGAGTGGLSRHVQLALENIVIERADPESDTDSSLEPFNFVLLDRQKFRSRNQVDYMIRTQARPVKPRVLRITMDVRDLKLQHLQLIHETLPGIAWPEWAEGGGQVKPQEGSIRVPTQYICISKHFCGSATDLALGWMREQHQQELSRPKPQDSYSICFATCCHGICDPSLLVAKPYLRELLNSEAGKKRKREDSVGTEGPTTKPNVSDEQLDIWVPWIIKLTGWATLGKQEESSLVARPGKDATTTTQDSAMSRDQRRILGKRCKKLLDMARCLYLVRECGFKQAHSVEYTSESVESGAIIGVM